jgi:hypothetical protein
VATYEDRHVLVSSVASKAILRAVADEAERRLKQVYYFPSYEIVTSPCHEGRYLTDDLRQVNETGVSHVMRVFGKHFGPPRNAQPMGRVLTPGHADRSAEIICDEEQIVKALEGERALNLANVLDASEPCEPKE